LHSSIVRYINSMIDVGCRILCTCIMSRSHAVCCRIQGEGYRNNIELPSLDGQNSDSMLAIDYTPPICLLVTRDAFHVSSIALRLDEIDHVLVCLTVFVAMKGC
jgi:hypothetical protein